MNTLSKFSAFLHTLYDYAYKLHVKKHTYEKNVLQSPAYSVSYAIVCKIFKRMYVFKRTWLKQLI